MNVQQLFSVQGKTVLVTGGSRGIGEMIATGYVSAGAIVYISSRSAEACEKVAKELHERGPGQCYAIPADLSKMEEVTRLVSELSKRIDHLDVLVNNAGATWGAGFAEFPDQAFDKVITLNLKRVFSLTQACYPLLSERASAECPSSVINIGSVDGIRTPVQESYAYSASKAGLHQLTRHLANRLGPEHILVNAIAPGPFQSKMMAETLKNFADVIVSKIPTGRIGSPEDVAGTCIYLSSRAGQYTNGVIIAIDGGYTASAL
ncbi:NAD(P)-binding protein [Backusella circina FSU 941]|nr:NAD(P)-binding protein [Backusella circina FSU 941]